MNERWREGEEKAGFLVRPSTFQKINLDAAVCRAQRKPQRCRRRVLRRSQGPSQEKERFTFLRGKIKASQAFASAMRLPKEDGMKAALAKGDLSCP